MKSSFLNFLIVAFVIFLIVRTLNNMQKKPAEKPAAPLAPPEDVQLLTEIRDLLKRQPVR